MASYPFPEIYIAAGSVDPQTGEGTEWLVDGQQRISTLYQYFEGSDELKIGRDFRRYAELTKEEQINFLEYDVVVRDLGNMSIDEIKEIFKKINATSYSLNAMEVHNSRFDGEFKKFAEEISQHSFFNRHRIFSANEIRRMRDISYVLIYIITIMSTYFNREDELETYLSQYNDEFLEKDKLRGEINAVFQFIDECNFDERSRVWKKSDLLTLLVEMYRLNPLIVVDKMKLSPHLVGERLKRFYSLVDIHANDDHVKLEGLLIDLKDISDYSKAASQATNDRGSRIRRGEIIHRVILDSEE
ncbi:MAG TPA: DUF262 domain-containing protein [Ktedonobacteraceae bacterium]|nr:DUF262 domain-containing protein [Ktedonobacteraceae bacterium]